MQENQLSTTPETIEAQRQGAQSVYRFAEMLDGLDPAVMSDEDITHAMNLYAQGQAVKREVTDAMSELKNAVIRFVDKASSAGKQVLVPTAKGLDRYYIRDDATYKLANHRQLVCGLVSSAFDKNDGDLDSVANDLAACLSSSSSAWKRSAIADLYPHLSEMFVREVRTDLKTGKPIKTIGNTLLEGGAS